MRPLGGASSICTRLFFATGLVGWAWTTRTLPTWFRTSSPRSSKKLPQFRYDSAKSFRAWLRTLTENRWRDRLRRLAARPKEVGDAPLDAVAAPVEVNLFSDEEYRQQLIGRAIQIMQGEFESATWKACWAAIVEGKKGAAVAAELGMKVEAVYQARSRVLRRLRQELCGLLD